jgi:tetratricopeptide (TPR) repeat protein
MPALLSSGLLAAALATNAPVAPTSTNTSPGFALTTSLADGAVERSYHELLASDDAAQTEIDSWINDANSQGGSTDAAALQKRINERITSVETAYREFLEKNPRHVEARIAFGSFLNDVGREHLAREEWEKALELDAQNPAIYNNLAGIYGHRGPVTNAFMFYEKAIELDPAEPVYYRNFATTVFLFRRDVMEHYAITNEQEVFDKALGLYRKALELEPTNFLIATDLAQTYYLIKPPRHDDAIAAWKRAHDLANDDLEREGVHIHLARIQGQAGRFDEAFAQLSLVTHAQLSVVKDRLARSLERKREGASTNAAPLQPSPPPQP